jgi:hypothetical protein
MSASVDCVLEFLKILPEEVTEGRKINLSVCFCDGAYENFGSVDQFVFLLQMSASVFVSTIAETYAEIDFATQL